MPLNDDVCWEEAGPRPRSIGMLLLNPAVRVMLTLSLPLVLLTPHLPECLCQREEGGRWPGEDGGRVISGSAGNFFKNRICPFSVANVCPPVSVEVYAERSRETCKEVWQKWIKRKGFCCLCGWVFVFFRSHHCFFSRSWDCHQLIIAGMENTTKSNVMVFIWNGGISILHL